MTQADILNNTIKCLSGLESRLKSLSQEEGFYMDDRLAKSYVFFKHALKNYYKIMGGKIRKP